MPKDFDETDLVVAPMKSPAEVTLDEIDHAIANLVDQERFINPYAFITIHKMLTAFKASAEAARFTHVVKAVDSKSLKTPTEYVGLGGQLVGKACHALPLRESDAVMLATQRSGLYPNYVWSAVKLATDEDGNPVAPVEPPAPTPKKPRKRGAR